MEVRYYDVTGARVKTDQTDLRLGDLLPNGTSFVGEAEIEINAKLKTLTFKHDGVSSAFSNVIFKVNHSLIDFEFTFKRLSHGGCEFAVSENFAFSDISCINLVSPEVIRNDIVERVKSNGYIY